jgi:ParB family chromosome partitioning protein
VSPNPHQPRQTISEDSLAELVASIREHGVIQPLVVTQVGDE